MSNKSMTESELKEFLAALKDSCGNEEKEQWYMGLIEDFEIAFTEGLNEVRGNEGKPISEDELYQQFQDQFILANADYWSEPAENCIQIAKKYSDSKLSELEKWIDENVFEEGSAYLVYSPELKAKIKSLK